MENPWTELPRRRPYVLARDLDEVGRFNSRAKEEHRLQLQLLPEPFLGDTAAPVVILNLNPGYAESDNRDYTTPIRRRMIRQALLHQLPTRSVLLFP